MRDNTPAPPVAGAATLALTAPAAAHVTIDPAEAPAEGYATLQFQVPHGCDDSPTRVVRVQIPEQVPSVTPQVHPGWEVTTKEGPKDAVELHGETITRGVKEVVWTATDADPLPADRLDLFGMSVKLPGGEAGDPVYFPTVQECVQGREAWIQIPQPGESAEELELPAPAVTLTAAAGGHGDSGHGGEEASDADHEAKDDDRPSTGLVIAALALGALGLLTGIAALLQARRNRG